MILKALTLENFKGIGEPVRIEFAPLTLLFGPNSSGKSTILSALQFASSLLGSRGRDPFDVSAAAGLGIGSFRDSVYGHDVSRSIALTFEVTLLGLSPDYDREGLATRIARGEEALDELDGLSGFGCDARCARLEFRISYDSGVGEAYLSEYRVDLDDIPFGSITCDEARASPRIAFLNYCHPSLIELDSAYTVGFDTWLSDCGMSRDEYMSDVGGDGSNTKLESFVGRWNSRYGRAVYPIEIRGRVGAIGNPWSRLELDLGEEREDWKDYSAACCIVSQGFLGPAAILEASLEKGTFLGPLRYMPTRDQFEFAANVSSKTTSGQNAWQYVMNAGPAFVDEVNRWLTDSAKLNTNYGIEVFRYREVPVANTPVSCSAPDSGAAYTVEAPVVESYPVRKRVMLRDTRSGIELTMRDVGVGLSQLLPIVVESLKPREGLRGCFYIVGVEQPELHLHPALQVALADLFAAASKAPSARFVIETHSEHLMLRCLRRIRETSEGKQVDDMPPMTPEEIAVHFIEPSDRGPIIHRIRIDSDGEFMDPWPRGFFPERAKEVYGDDL